MKSLVLFTLLLLAPLSTAQEAPREPGTEAVNEQSAIENPDGGNAVDASADYSGKAPDQQAPTAEGTQPSPFDYNPSEEISEDLSVSFPVDI